MLLPDSPIPAALNAAGLASFTYWPLFIAFNFPNQATGTPCVDLSHNSRWLGWKGGIEVQRGTWDSLPFFDRGAFRPLPAIFITLYQTLDPWKDLSGCDTPFNNDSDRHEMTVGEKQVDISTLATIRVSSQEVPFLSIISKDKMRGLDRFTWLDDFGTPRIYVSSVPLMRKNSWEVAFAEMRTLSMHPHISGHVATPTSYLNCVLLRPKVFCNILRFDR